MKIQHILPFYISLLFSVAVFSQQKVDTVKTKQVYGIRIGIDISKPVISFVDADKKGLELTGDIRFKPNYYLVTELGYEDVIQTEDYLNYATKGTYIKLGINYNAYQNWKGMRNEIYLGTRYAFGLYTQTLNSYSVNVSGTYFEPELIEINKEYADLTAHWLEFVIGMKVETFHNLFLGAQLNVKKMITIKEPDNFKNLYIPGFNRVFENNMGIGFNYTLSYLIPIIKKNK